MRRANNDSNSGCRRFVVDPEQKTIEPSVLEREATLVDVVVFVVGLLDRSNEGNPEISQPTSRIEDGGQCLSEWRNP